jgi:DNA-binding response OmpR family regulator
MAVPTDGILVVVDDLPTQELVRRTLEAEGRTVEAVRSAKEAGERVRAGTYGLVILDLILPDADGRGLLLEWTGGGEHAPVPVVILSGSPSASQDAECLACGAESVLEKPVDPSALTAAVRAVFGREGSGAQGARDALPGPGELRRRFTELEGEMGRRGAPLTVVLLRTQAPLDPGAAPEGGGDEDEDPVAGRVAAMMTELRGRLRDEDVLGRLGAEELVLILPGRSPEEAAALVGSSGDGLRVGIAGAEPGAFFEDVLSDAHHGIDDAPDSGRRARGRVLIVEDDPITAGLVRHRLERSGFRVDHLENGTDALEAMRNRAPDLAVLDIRLPGMSGFELLSRMREEDLLAGVPVLMLTSMGSESDVSRGFELGADDYLVKPFSPTELVARSLRLIRR